mmetsp:Transcript_21663/g.34775  ORF Transcript_21663/g.34775 Transcript_21663/m.34775 type:complete len:310 (-) Transcript_21663:595-1524(-)
MAPSLTTREACTCWFLRREIAPESFFGLLRVRHGVHLVGHIVDEGRHRVGVCTHLSKALLNLRLVNETLAKDLTVVGPLVALLNDEAVVAVAADSHSPALVVKVGHGELESLALLAKQVAYRNLDILKGDKRRVCNRAVRGLDALGGDTFGALNQEQGKTAVPGATSAHKGREVVSRVTASNPLFEASDNVVAAISGLLGYSRGACNITASVRVGDGKANALLTTEDTRNNALHELRGSEVQDGRETNYSAAAKAITKSPAAATLELLLHDTLCSVVELLRLDAGRKLVHELEVLAGAKRSSNVAKLTH